MIGRKGGRSAGVLPYSLLNQCEHQIRLLVQRSTLRLYVYFFNLSNNFLSIFFVHDSQSAWFVEWILVYMLQEIITGAGHTSAVDWWALGS